MKKVLSVLLMAVVALAMGGCQKDSGTKENTYAVNYTFSLKNGSDEFNDLVSGIEVYVNDALKGTVTDNDSFTGNMPLNATESVVVSTKTVYKSGYSHNPEKTLKAEFSYDIMSLTNDQRTDCRQGGRVLSQPFLTVESAKEKIDDDFNITYKVVVSSEKAVFGPTN